MKHFLLLTFFMAVPISAWAGIVPHVADYTITLEKRHQDNDLQNITGTMRYSLRHTCDAWVSDYTANMDFSMVRNRIESQNSLSFVELHDGKTFQYAVRHEENGRLTKNSKGVVENKGDKMSVIYRDMSGESKTHVIEAGILFPTNHLKKIIEKAKSGTFFFTDSVFDGSDNEGYYRISSLTKPINDNEWRVSMAFFDAMEKTAEPDYEMTFSLPESGILKDIVISYPNFTVRQSMTSVKLLERAACD
jgi:hypothetical protein